VGKGLFMDLEKMSLQDYLKSQRFSDELFTGDGPLRFQEFWEIMVPIHMAPEMQINYRKKIGAVVSMLGGRAKKAMTPYLGMSTREGYLDVWRQLFRAHAETKVRGSWIKQFLLNNSDLMFSDPESFLTGVRGALNQHRYNGEDIHNKAMEAWSHILIGLRKDFNKFVATIPNFWPRYKNTELYLDQDPFGALEEFIQYMTYDRSNEESQNSILGTLHVMRAAAKEKQRTRSESPQSETERLSAKERWEQAVKVAQEKEARVHRAKRPNSPEKDEEQFTAKKIKTEQREKTPEKRPRSRSPRTSENKGGSNKGSDQIRKRKCPLYKKCRGFHSFFDCPLNKKEREEAVADNCRRCGFPGHKKYQCRSKQGCMECTRRGKAPKDCDHPTLSCKHLFTENGKWIGKYTDFPRSERKFIFEDKKDSDKKEKDPRRSKSRHDFAPPASYEPKRSQSAAPRSSSVKPKEESDPSRKKI
jgi:hypothetical protein